MSCRFCKEEFSNSIFSDDDNHVGLYKSGDRFKMFYTDDGWGEIEESIKFNYCPKCGRKLEE